MGKIQRVRHGDQLIPTQSLLRVPILQRLKLHLRMTRPDIRHALRPRRVSLEALQDGVVGSDQSGGRGSGSRVQSRQGLVELLQLGFAETGDEIAPRDHFVQDQMRLLQPRLVLPEQGRVYDVGDQEHYRARPRRFEVERYEAFCPWESVEGSRCEGNAVSVTNTHQEGSELGGRRGSSWSRLPRQRRLVVRIARFLLN